MALSLWGTLGFTQSAQAASAAFSDVRFEMAGDAVRMLVRVAGIEVSIRARHCWRAMPS